MDRILLFIPAYNCQKQIVRVLEQLDRKVMSYISKVIVVNNISTDKTEEKVLHFIHSHPDMPIELLRNNENYGLGGSHKVAFRYALENDFDYMIVLHGDDQGSIKDFLPLLKKCEYRKYDCCLGARFMAGSQLQGYSKFRTFGNIVYNILFSLVVKDRIYDLGAGLNMYKVDMLKTPFYIKFPDNLMFNYCMVLAASFYGHKCRFIPISWREDDQISNVKMVNQAIKVLQMLWKFMWNKKGFLNSELRESPKKEYRSKLVDGKGQ